MLAERERELGLIDDTLARARESSGGALLLCGELVPAELSFLRDLVPAPVLRLARPVLHGS